MEAVKGHQAIGGIIEAVSDALSRFADKAKGADLPGFDRKTGISTLYSRKRNGIVRFCFVSRDDYLINVDYDINKTSHEYIDGMMRGAAQDLRAKRQAERASRLVWTPEYMQ